MVKLLVLLSLFIGCTSTIKKTIGPETKKSKNKKTKPPRWVFDPMSKCDKEVEFCLVGEGKSKEQARADALAALASIFEIKVDNELTHVQEGEQVNEQDVIEGKTQESYENRTNLKTKDIILKGVEYKLLYKQKSDNVRLYFMLFSLNKLKTAALLQTEINHLDNRMQEIFRFRKRSGYKTLRYLYQQRRLLNDKHQIVNGRRVAKIISYDQINNLKETLLKKTPLISLNIRSLGDVEQKNTLIQDLIIKALVDNHFKVELGPTTRSNFIVSGSFKTKKQFLNVKGFVRYKYTLNLYAKNSNGQHLGASLIETTQMGRSQEQTLEKALQEFKIQLIEKNRIKELEI